jgi:hypothetical protein
LFRGFFLRSFLGSPFCCFGACSCFGGTTSGFLSGSLFGRTSCGSFVGSFLGSPPCCFFLCALLSSPSGHIFVGLPLCGGTLLSFDGCSLASLQGTPLGRFLRLAKSLLPRSFHLSSLLCFLGAATYFCLLPGAQGGIFRSFGSLAF